MKKPYLKKYGQITKFTVWIVDGSYVRTNLDEEFLNFGQHYCFKFIPKNEFWLDKEYHEGEEKYFIDHLLVENRLMKAGKSRIKAIDEAERFERRERNKSKLIQNIKNKKLPTKEIIQKVHKKLFKKYSTDQIKTWLINGELVRDLFYVDFTEGGHGKIFPFIPQDEIWLDDDLNPEERKFVLLHELHEYNLMPKSHPCLIKNKVIVLNDNYTKLYDTAHRLASELEYFCRHHPSQVDQKIKKELAKSKTHAQTKLMTD